MSAASPWSWHGPAGTVSGPAWGGSLEIVDFHLRTGRYLLPDSAYDGAVLFLETSEETTDVPLVVGVDFGHTDPQLVIPSGGTVTVDSAARQIAVTF
jgi:muramoyltetrapeptide carboxypeptidase LdcA involved in peptidoglycan recycling